MPVHRFEFRNYRPFKSPDGGGFNATLYVDGVKAADVFNGGSGGPTEVLQPRARYMGATYTGPSKWRALLALLEAAGNLLYAKENPGETLKNLPGEEWLLGDLEMRAQAAKNCKRAIIVQQADTYVEIRPSKGETVASLLANPEFIRFTEARYKGKVVNDGPEVGPLSIDVPDVAAPAPRDRVPPTAGPARA